MCIFRVSSPSFPLFLFFSLFLSLYLATPTFSYDSSLFSHLISLPFLRYSLPLSVANPPFLSLFPSLSHAIPLSSSYRDSCLFLPQCLPLHPTLSLFFRAVLTPFSRSSSYIISLFFSLYLLSLAIPLSCYPFFSLFLSPFLLPSPSCLDRLFRSPLCTFFSFVLSLFLALSIIAGCLISSFIN